MKSLRSALTSMGHMLRILQEHGFRELCRALHRRYVYRYHPEKTRFLPTAMEVEITTHCNLRCAMCRGGFGISEGLDRRHLSPERFTRLMDRLHFLKSISLRGAGEPSLHPELVALAASAVRRGVRLRIFTNGMEMTPPLGAALAALPVEEIVFSIDACRPETYARIRKGGRLDRVLEHLEALGKVLKDREGCRLSVMFIVMRSNFREFPGLLERIDGMGVATLVPKMLYPGDHPEVRKEVLSVDEAAAFREMINDLDGATTRVETEGSLRKAQEPGKVPCMKIWESPFITLDGHLSLCPAAFYRGGVAYGNLYDHAFLDLWNGPRIRAHRAAIARGESPLCNACPAMKVQPF